MSGGGSYEIGPMRQSKMTLFLLFRKEFPKVHHLIRKRILGRKVFFLLDMHLIPFESIPKDPKIVSDLKEDQFDQSHSKLNKNSYLELLRAVPKFKP